MYIYKFDKMGYGDMGVRQNWHFSIVEPYKLKKPDQKSTSNINFEKKNSTGRYCRCRLQFNVGDQKRA